MAQARICPSCQGEYGPEVETCPQDGRRLVSLQDAEQRLLGRTLEGKYTLEALVGRGGIGVVFRARQHSMERPVALKVLRRGLLEDESSVRRFLREVQGAGRVTHPNTVTAFDFGQTEEGELYLVMELLEGRTLGEILAAEGRLSPERTVALLAGICDGLHAAHEAGVVHRDIKPENVLVLPDTGPTGEFVKVVDFGLAQLKSVQGAESITKTGAICGTPAYMSPEQALDRPVDRRTDIYSLGVMAWQLLTGSLPFTGDSPMRLLLAHLHEAPPPLALRAPWVPPALATVVMEALAKDPADRPATAAEFKRRLLSAMGVTGPQPRLEGPAPGGHARLSQPTLDRLPGSLSQPTLDPVPAGLAPTLPSGSLPGVVVPPGAGPAPSVPALPAVTSGAGGSRPALLAVVGGVVVVAGLLVVRALQSDGVAADARVTDARAADARAADARAAVVPDDARVADARVADARVADAQMAEVPVDARVAEVPVDARVADVRPADAEPPAPPLDAGAPDAAAADGIWIHSRPAGAEVVQAGAVVGTTPYRLARPAEPIRLTIRLKRHEARTVRVDPRRTAPVQITLRRLPEIVE